ncbi:MAG: hypothetical protein H7X92_03785 [Chitinophagales bacterium]|nr:hypothetical protein [Hyphomicrobiales bacterium]
MNVVIGWDIGGAHVKCARAVNGRIVEVRQIPCTLWLGEHHLADAVASLQTALHGADLHRITMTGELAENFANRAEGVGTIVSTMARLLPPPVMVYIGADGFAHAEHIHKYIKQAASANWHASAALVARMHEQALFIDIGSTTTDITPIKGGVEARGYVDAERLTAGELLYTGAVRTPIMAIATDAPFAGVRQRLMAENFSTIADVYRLTGELRPEHDQYAASDGRGKSADECRARLARMLGRDALDAPDDAWGALAAYFRQRQIAMIYDAVAQALSGVPLDATAPIVGAGAGSFLARVIAARLGRPYIDFGALIGGDCGEAASLCAPASALALLPSGPLDSKRNA